MNTIIKLNNIEKSYKNGKVKNEVLTNFSWNFEINCFTVLAKYSCYIRST